MTYCHTSPQNFVAIQLVLERFEVFFEKYKICQKRDKYWIDLESLKLKGPQVGIIFTSGSGT